jgi:hypothetical protein
MAKKNPTPFEPEGFAPPPVETTFKDFERLGNQQLEEQRQDGTAARVDSMFQSDIPSPPPAPQAAPGPNDPGARGDYEGMSRADRDIAILSEMEEPIPQEQIDAGVAAEEQRSAAATQQARAARDEARRLEYDASIRRGEGGQVEQYPAEVEAWMARNASQYDVEMQRKYKKGDVPFDKQAEGDARLYAMAQRQQREVLRDVAIGAGLTGAAQSQFEAWKANGGRWPGPYGSMAPEALRAAQNYYMQFGKPSGSARQDAAPAMTFEEYQQRKAAGEFEQELSIPGGVSAESAQRSAEIQRKNESRFAAAILREMRQGGVLPEDVDPDLIDGATSRRQDKAIQNYLESQGFGSAREWYKSQTATAREESGRKAAVRALMRRDPGARAEQLARVNQGLSPYMQISRAEIGLPERQAVGAVRDVEDLSEVSMQTAIEGEYLRSPQGTFRIAKGASGEGMVRVPVRQVNGSFVPDADRMDYASFSANYLPSERRAVAKAISSSGTNEYSSKQRAIARSRARISDSDSYTQAEKDEALARLREQESKLHHDYLQNASPGDVMPVELAPIPEMTQRERERDVRIRKAEEDLLGGDSEEGFLTIGGEAPAPAAPASQGSGVENVIGQYESMVTQYFNRYVQSGSQDAEAIVPTIKQFIENNWQALSAIPEFGSYETPSRYWEKAYPELKAQAEQARMQKRESR